VGQQGSEVAQVILTPKHGDRMDWQVLPYTDNPVSAADAERDKVLRAVVELSEQGVSGLKKPNSNHEWDKEQRHLRATPAGAR
jgi:hypothetical protein